MRSASSAEDWSSFALRDSAAARWNNGLKPIVIRDDKSQRPAGWPRRIFFSKISGTGRSFFCVQAFIGRAVHLLPSLFDNSEGQFGDLRFCAR
jgi:hypothetical protein